MDPLAIITSSINVWSLALSWLTFELFVKLLQETFISEKKHLITWVGWRGAVP